MGESRGAYRVLEGKRRGSRPLGRPRRRWEDTIKMNLKQMGWGRGQDRSGSEQRQVASCCECGHEPSGSIKCGEFF